MLGWLSTLWNWRGALGWCAAGAITLGAWLWLGVKESRNEALRAEIARLAADVAAKDAALEEAARVSAANAEAMAALRAEADRRIAAIAAERDAALKRAGKVRTIIREVERAPDSEDGPVADVLRRTLDGLRQLQSTPAAPGRNPGRTDRGA